MKKGAYLPKGSLGERRSPSLPGFTLIELLVVMAIIAILAGLVLRTAGYVQRKAATSRAESEIAALNAALEAYKADNGDYPEGTNGSPSVTTTTGANNRFLRDALQPEVTTKKVYFEFPGTMGTNANRNVEDPFGENYGYMYPVNPSLPNVQSYGPTNFYLIWSRSGTTNTNQWIKSW